MKTFNYKINGTAYKVAINSADSEVVELEVNGTPYVVELEQKKKKTISSVKKQAAPAVKSPVAASAGPAPKKPAAAGGSVLNSPLPGLVLDIRVKEGDQVKKGQTVIVLEAMKMENNIQAATDGTVSKIVVEKGATVLEGDQLLIIA